MPKLGKTEKDVTGPVGLFWGRFKATANSIGFQMVFGPEPGEVRRSLGGLPRRYMGLPGLLGPPGGVRDLPKSMHLDASVC